MPVAARQFLKFFWGRVEKLGGVVARFTTPRPRQARHVATSAPKSLGGHRTGDASWRPSREPSDVSHGPGRVPGYDNPPPSGGGF